MRNNSVLITPGECVDEHGRGAGRAAGGGGWCLQGEVLAVMAEPRD